MLEVIGWDECFLGVDTDDPESVAASAQAAVREATGLHCPVGIGDDKVRAKIAREFGKLMPSRRTIVTVEAARTHPCRRVYVRGATRKK